MGAVVVPCNTAESIEAFNGGVERLKSFATRVHVDIMDGVFTPNASPLITEMTWPDNWQVDIHAMVAFPSKFIDTWIARKPHMIILHAEAQEPLDESIAKIKAAGIKLGIALLKTTVPKSVTPLIEKADHVMIFSGQLGYYGGKASMMQLEKVRLIRMIHPDVEIGWDGGASIDNAFSLAQGDVNVINAGGAINKADDPAGAYKRLSEEINKHSVM